MRGYFGRKTAIVAALLASTSMAQAEDVEVLHWWTSGGEASALNVLKDNLGTKEIGWIDMPVAGGGGHGASRSAQRQDRRLAQHAGLQRWD